MAKKKAKKKGFLGLFGGKDKKEEAPEEVKDVSSDDEETKESMPPVSDVEHVPATDDPAPAEEVAVEEVSVESEEAVEAAPVDTVPGRPRGAPSPEHVDCEWVNAGFHIYKMNGTGGYRKNKKLYIKIEE